MPKVAQTYNGAQDSLPCSPRPLVPLSYVERNETILLILGNGLSQGIASQTQFVVARNEIEFDQADQTGFLHRRMSLIGAIGHEPSVDLRWTQIGKLRLHSTNHFFARGKQRDQCRLGSRRLHGTLATSSAREDDRLT